MGARGSRANPRANLEMIGTINSPIELEYLIWVSFSTWWPSFVCKLLLVSIDRHRILLHVFL